MSWKTCINIFLNLYPLWIIGSSIAGFLYPPLFSWFTGNWMVIAMITVMLGMGITLQVKDFKALLKMPVIVFLAAIIQYTIMPLGGWSIAKWLHLDPSLAVGVILVSCCPGGTASNVLTFLARANLALSIIMTSVSTLLAIVVTPLLCELLAGKYVPVDSWGMFMTTIQVVLIPVALGVYINYKYPEKVQKVSSAGPILSVLAIIFIAGSIVAQSADVVAENAGILFLATALLHTIGFISGYVFTRICRFDKTIAKTTSIETGMQNGGLAAVLAKQNFTAQPLVAIPSVFSSVIQTLLGGLIAGYWRLQKENKKE